MEQSYPKTTASNIQTLAVDKYKQASSAISGFVSTSPWKAIGIAATVGATVGAVIAFISARR